MRWFGLSLVFLFCLSFVSAVIPDDCITYGIDAYWKMDGNAEDSVASFDGRGYVKSAASPTDSILEDAALFSGSDKITIAETGNVLDLTGSSTIGFWFKEDSDPPEGGMLISKAGAYSIEWDYSGGPVGRVKATYNGISVTSSDIDATSSHMITVVHNFSNLSIYVDGSHDATVPHRSYMGPTGTDFVIGDGFEGWIDEVVLYNRALAPHEVRGLHDKTSGGRDYCYVAGASRTSSTQTNFTIDGCEIPGFGGLAVDRCSRDGRYYCEDVGVWYDTIKNNSGCTRGEANPTEMKNQLGTDDVCCPRSYTCGDLTNSPLDGEYNCTLRMVSCSSETTPEDCRDAQCFWLEDEDGNGVCTESPSDYSCNFYNNPNDCREDVWNLGRTGTGTDICGKYVTDDLIEVGYVVPEESCKCFWDSGDGECFLSYDVVPDVHDGNPAQFTCLKNFTLGGCVDGFQDISWNVSLTDLTDEFTNDLSPLEKQAIQNMSNCQAGSNERSCGDPIIKLPFFSLASLFFTSLILVLYYLGKVYKEKEL